MTNADAITQLTSLKGQKQIEVDALTAALAVLQTGFTSELASVNAQVAEKLAIELAALKLRVSTVV